MTAYTQALQILSPILAATFWIATGLLIRQANCANARRRRLGSILWTAHAATYWTVNAILRLFFDYTAPTLAISAWAAILFVHAAASILGMAMLLLRYESSPDSHP